MWHRRVRSSVGPRSCGGGGGLFLASRVAIRSPSCLHLCASNASISYRCTPCRRFSSSATAMASSSAAAAAAAAATTTKTFDATAPSAAAAVSSSAAPSTVFRFYDTFLESAEDPSGEMLLEAHAKHGVWLNVPPQAAPSALAIPPPAEPGGFAPDPPLETAIPPLRLSAKQRARLASLQMAYEPRHDPPPLHTTGTRALSISFRDHSYQQSPQEQQQQQQQQQQGQTQSAASDQAGRSVSPGRRRHPPNADALFHCTECGKGYRQRAAAVAHAQARHPSVSAERAVAAGPGPGEVMDDTTAAAAAAARDFVLPAAPTNTTTSTRSSSSSSGGGDDQTKSPSLTTTATTSSSEKEAAARAGAGETTATPYDTAVLRLPEEDEVTRLLLEVWDTVAMRRDDIAKPAHIKPDKDFKPTLAGAADADADDAAAGADDGDAKRSPARQSPHKVAFDSRGGELFIPAAFAVEGKADRRDEQAASAKPLVRATPADATPGVKRTGTTRTFRQAAVTAGEAAAATDGRAAALRAMSVRERSRRYPNPFGESANSVAAELEMEPINPFLDLEGAAGTTAATSKMKKKESKDSQEMQEKEKEWLARPFECPLCAAPAPRFRLLSGLRRHISSAHATDSANTNSSSSAADMDALLTPEQLQELYATERNPQLAVRRQLERAARQQRGGGGGASSSITADSGAHRDGNSNSSSGGSDNSNSSAGAAAGGGGGDDKDNNNNNNNNNRNDHTATLEKAREEAEGEAAVMRAVPAEQLRVHVRSVSNIVVSGAVVDVQRGFSGADEVLQCVVRVRGGGRARDGSERPADEEAEDELLVVRCTGSLLPANLLAQQLRVGSQVLASGLLRLNYQRDEHQPRQEGGEGEGPAEVTGHYYPIVQVVPPLGFIRVLS